MLIRDIVGTTLLAFVASALALAPGAVQVPGTAGAPGATSPASSATAEEPLIHPCPDTSESECRVAFLPPLKDQDPDGGAHSSHAPEVRICGPLDEGVSWQSVSSCDDAGTGPEVEHFPFGCGDMSECVEVHNDHYHADWTASAGDGCDGEEDNEGDGDEGDEDEDCDDDDDDDEDDEDDEDEEDGDGSSSDLEDGFYLIEARLNGNSAGGVVVEIGQGGGPGTPPKFNNGSTVPIKFRLHDKIIG